LIQLIEYRLFWHPDDNFIAETGIIHQPGLNPEPGVHLLTILDEKGSAFSTRFTIIDK
jgi:penicillin-binding protein 1C